MASEKAFPEFQGVEQVSSGWINKYVLKFRLPDGRYVALAVFLCNSLESPETNLSLIKDITRLSVDWLARQPMLLQGGTARP